MGRRAIYKEILQIDTIITAGDSLLDLCMLEKANHAFAPLHGELGQCMITYNPYFKTDAIGIYAAEEIVNKSLQIIHSSLPTS